MPCIPNDRSAPNDQSAPNEQSAPHDRPPTTRRSPSCRPTSNRPRSGEERESSLIGVSTATSDDEIGELLACEPFAFLALAAEAITHPHQQAIPDLVEKLTAMASLESSAVATAVAWLHDGTGPSLRASDGGMPSWLAELDQARIVQAKRRDEVPEKTSYLLEVEFVGGRIGTLQGRVDHGQGGALTNAWVTDEPLSTIESLICSLTRRQPETYRPVTARIAADALAVAVERSEGADLPSPAVNRWPALRPLIEFALTTWSTGGTGSTRNTGSTGGTRNTGGTE